MKANYSSGQIQMIMKDQAKKVKIARRREKVMARLRKDKRQLKEEVDASVLIGTEADIRKSYNDMINTTDDIETKDISSYLFKELCSSGRLRRAGAKMGTDLLL